MKLSGNPGRKMMVLALLVVALLGNLMFPTSQAAKPQAGAGTTAGFTVVGWGDNATGQLSFPADLGGVTAIAAGYGHSLALKSDGTVVARGSNAEGQSTIPAGLLGVTAIAAGELHSLALKSNGTVVGWGKNNAGQATPLPGLSGITAIAAGSSHSLARRSSGTVVGWGANDAGQLNIPAGLSGVTAIAAGGSHSLARRLNGTVVAWGANDAGQLNIPAGLSGVTAIAAGGSHSLALKNDGTVVAWGSNGAGQLNVPADLTGVTAIAAGQQYSLALKNDGTIVGWGGNAFGEANTHASVSGVIAIAAGGHHSLALVERRVVNWHNSYLAQNRVYGLSEVTAIGAGHAHSIALKSDGTVAVLEDDMPPLATPPADLTGVTAIAAGDLYSLALKSDGTVVGWGQTTIPPGLSGVTAIAAGALHSLALKGDGTVVGWQSFGSGPVNIPEGLSGVTAIAARGFHSLALKSDGTVVGWGSNSSGQVNIPEDLSDVVAIAAGSSHSLALKSDGTVVGWGDNFSGQVDIPAGLSGVTAIAAGVTHSLALKEDGTVVGWGEGSAQPQAGLRGVTAIAAGNRYSLALGVLLNRPPVAVTTDATVSAGADCMATVAILEVDGGSHDPDSHNIFSRSISPAGPFGIGSHTVTLSITDFDGASGSATATVTVIDATPPQLTAIPPNATYQCIGEVPAGSPTQATATDICGEATITVADDTNGGAGTIASPLVISRRFTATDASGNNANATQTITVIDNTAPIIVCPTPITVEGSNALGGAMVNFSVTATDNCGDSPSVSYSKAPGSMFPIGATTVTVTATDGAGNSSSCSFTVNVTVPSVPSADVDFFLHGSRQDKNPTTLFVSSTAPTAATARFRDSPALNFDDGNPWKEIGAWSAAAPLTTGTLNSLSKLHAWVGLKDSDEQWTRFDLRVEVYKGGALVVAGDSYCIDGLVGNANQAKEVTLAFVPFAPVTFNGSSERLSVKILTRMGTNGAGASCGSQNHSAGLRLYFDATTRQSRLGVTF